MATASVVLFGNEAITHQIVNIRSEWSGDSKNRMKFGKLFSELRASIQRYNKDAEKGISYNEAVRLTSVPRATAERWREAFEVCKDNNVPVQTFEILAEAGFNLATDLQDDILPATILADNPDLKSADYLLSLSNDDTKKLVERLQKGYGKEEQKLESIESIQEELSELKEQSATLPPSLKEAAERAIKDKTVTMRNKMLWAVRNIANALAPLLGHNDDEWAENYISQFRQDGKVTVLVEQAYREAVKFAQSATFLGVAAKKPAASAKSIGSKVSRSA